MRHPNHKSIRTIADMPGKTQGMYKQLHDRSFPEHRCVIRIINQLEPSQMRCGWRRERTEKLRDQSQPQADAWL